MSLKTNVMGSIFPARTQESISSWPAVHRKRVGRVSPAHARIQHGLGVGARSPVMVALMICTVGNFALYSWNIAASPSASPPAVHQLKISQPRVPGFGPAPCGQHDGGGA